jgi:hypothetical protein
MCATQRSTPVGTGGTAAVRTHGTRTGETCAASARKRGMMKKLLLLLPLLSLGCETPNYVVAPKPAEADPQFVIEREMTNDLGDVRVRVIRDKVNGNLIYVTPGSGIAVIKEDNSGTK